jgi:DNA-binding transcriptional ArsR family regulator
MSQDDWKDEMKKLREELSALKEQLRAMREQNIRKRKGIYIDFGERVRDYVEDIMEGIVEGISGELEKSVFIGPYGVTVYRREPSIVKEKLGKIDPVKVASVMSALGNEHRIRILGELMHGGRYISELLERLPEITSSTLSSHLDILREAGLVVQEKVRGRYLITMPGRIAYKMAQRISKLISKREQDEAL